jgi:hypothetical protein
MQTINRYQSLTFGVAPRYLKGSIAKASVKADTITVMVTP